MANLPADVINEALDAAGGDRWIGDPEEGTRQAQIALRKYSQCMRQVMRAAHWNTFRKYAPMLLLADATGNTPNVGTLTASPDFTYEYALPNDCLQPRFVPWNPATQSGQVPAGNISIPTTPLTSVPTTAPVPIRLRPARFLMSSDSNYPPTPQPSGAYQLGPELAITAATQANPCQLTVPGLTFGNGQLLYINGVVGMTQLNGQTVQAANVNATAGTFTLEDAQGNAINSTNYTAYSSAGYIQTVTPQLPVPAALGQATQFWEVPGLSPVARTVILTNVKSAYLVYTAFLPYPSLWDPSFRAAFVAHLASEIALPLAKDKKFGMQLRAQQIAIARDRVTEARIRDGNEDWANSDLTVDWMNTRRVGGSGYRDGMGGDGPGVLWYGWGSMGFDGAGNSSAF